MRLSSEAKQQKRRKGLALRNKKSDTDATLLLKSAIANRRKRQSSDRPINFKQKIIMQNIYYKQITSFLKNE